jgi:7-cyano-7-deazaguanine synthase
MKTVVLLSGGMDSTTLLYERLYYRYDTVRAVSVYYGQRHKKELEYARRTCEKLTVPFDVVDLSAIGSLLTGSALTDLSVAVPEGHYAEESMKATVVPNRNMMMLSIATAVAITHGYDQVAFAAHAGDHAIYPDCRREFVDALNASILLCDWNAPHLDAPFLDMTKADICKLGYRLGVPYEETWSCYVGGDVHCGKCGTDVERIEAFADAEVPDPTVYA